MFNKDCFVSITLLEEEIKTLKQKEQTEDTLRLISYCERELEIMNHVTRTGVKMFGCTIEEFKEQLKEKPHVLILSDKELKKVNKAIKIMDILENV